jgi:hypothetical protein
LERNAGGDIHEKFTKPGVPQSVETISYGATLAIATTAVVAALTMPKNADASPGRSTSIALASDETRVVIVNREANSVSIIQVKDKNGNDVTNKEC